MRTAAMIGPQKPGGMNDLPALPNHSSGAVWQDCAAFIAELGVLGRVEIAPACLREPGSTREPTPVVAALMSFRRGVSLLNDSLPRNSRV